MCYWLILPEFVTPCDFPNVQTKSRSSHRVFKRTHNKYDRSTDDVEVRNIVDVEGFNLSMSRDKERELPCKRNFGRLSNWETE